MTAGQLWAGVDVGKEHHWVCVVDDNGKVVLSRRLVNDEHPIRELVAEIDDLAERVSWTVDLTTRPWRDDANRLYVRMGFERRETHVFRYSFHRF